jgi:predicted XRE-type DNA-binding protein
VKPIAWIDDARDCLRAFPPEARREAGYQLEKVQRGEQPADWKPMPAIGLGVSEIRVRVGGAFRVIYLAKLPGDLRATRVSEEVPQDGSRRSRTVPATLPDVAPEAEAGLSEKIKITRGSGNIFLDLGFSKTEAENLRLRSELMMRITVFYRESGLTQGECAKALGLTQPRLNALLKGKIGQFSLDALVNIASRAGLSVRLVVKKAA